MGKKAVRESRLQLEIDLAAKRDLQRRDKLRSVGWVWTPCAHHPSGADRAAYLESIVDACDELIADFVGAAQHRKNPGMCVFIVADDDQSVGTVVGWLLFSDDPGRLGGRDGWMNDPLADGGGVALRPTGQLVTFRDLDHESVAATSWASRRPEFVLHEVSGPDEDRVGGVVRSFGRKGSYHLLEFPVPFNPDSVGHPAATELAQRINTSIRDLSVELKLTPDMYAPAELGLLIEPASIHHLMLGRALYGAHVVLSSVTLLASVLFMAAAIRHTQWFLGVIAVLLTLLGMTLARHSMRIRVEDDNRQLMCPKCETDWDGEPVCRECQGDLRPWTQGTGAPETWYRTGDSARDQSSTDW